MPAALQRSPTNTSKTRKQNVTAIFKAIFRHPVFEWPSGALNISYCYWAWCQSIPEHHAFLHSRRFCFSRPALKACKNCLPVCCRHGMVLTTPQGRCTKQQPRTASALSFAHQLCTKPTKLLQGGNLLLSAVSLSPDFQISPGITTLSAPPARGALSHNRKEGQVPPYKSRSNS